jgi:hypothetical protein
LSDYIFAAIYIQVLCDILYVFHVVQELVSAKKSSDHENSKVRAGFRKGDGGIGVIDKGRWVEV